MEGVLTLKNKNLIGKLSKLFNVPISTLRYWENEGLVDFKRIPENNYRFWSVRTIRTLCDITFYRKLSIPIKKLKQIHSMNYKEIECLLSDSREDLCQKIKTMQETINHIDIKLAQVQTIKELHRTPMEFITTSFPGVRPFHLMDKDDISNLFIHEKNLIVMIDYNTPDTYNYGLFVSDEYQQNDLVRVKDNEPRLYLRVLMRTSYENIEENNLNECYEFMYKHGYKPGLAMGKVLASAFSDGLYNYYDTWIEANKIK